MKCMFVILNNTEKLDELLKELCDKGIKGATIFESIGMAQKLLNSEEDYLGFISSLRYLLNPERENNVTICIVLTDEQVLLARATLPRRTKSIEIPRFTTICEAYLRNLQQIYNKIELLHEKKNREVKLQMISLFI